MTLFVIILSLMMILFGLPIAVSLGVSSILCIIIFDPVPLVSIPQILFSNLESYILVSIPFYIFAGVLMDSSGIAKKLINFSRAMAGWSRGGLGAVNIISSFIFGGISGSSVADTVAIGSIMIPEMEKENYPKGYAAAITVISSTLAVVVPPSILLILLGAIGGSSISWLLLGGIIPGSLMALAMLVQNYFITKKHGYGRTKPFSWKELLGSFLKAIPALGVPAIIIGGILSGIITPSESGGIAVLYTLAVSLIFYKSLSRKTVYDSIINTAKYSAAVMLVVASSAIFTFILTYEEIPHKIAYFLLNLTENPVGILLFINLFILLSGMLIDAGVAIIVLIPILMPVIELTSINPIHFGVVFVLNLAIGLVTPPFGVCLFSVCNVGKISIEALVKNSLPLYLSLLLVLLLITFFPGLVLFLPRVLMG